MANTLKIVIGQLNFLVGDIAGNLEKMLHSCQIAQKKFDADLIVFPELALCGYPPEDLLLHSGMVHQIDTALKQLLTASQEIAIIVGFPHYHANAIYNAAAMLHKGQP